MYSPNRRVRFWEQEGHKWKTLQLKGRKYSHSAVRVGTLDSGDALGVIAAAQKALHRLGDPREAELAEPLGELKPRSERKTRGSGRGTVSAAS